MAPRGYPLKKKESSTVLTSKTKEGKHDSQTECDNELYALVAVPSVYLLVYFVRFHCSIVVEDMRISVKTVPASTGSGVVCALGWNETVRCARHCLWPALTFQPLEDAVHIAREPLPRVISA